MMSGFAQLGWTVDGPFELEVGRAMPLGLLCCEIILNALRHAWPQTQRGELSVKLRTKGAHCDIRIATTE